MLNLKLMSKWRINFKLKRRFLSCLWWRSAELSCGVDTFLPWWLIPAGTMGVVFSYMFRMVMWGGTQPSKNVGLILPLFGR